MYLIASDSIAVKIHDDSLDDLRSSNGNTGKPEAVDMVFVGSKSGHVELRYVLLC
jgi:hypothetical protein